MFRKPAHISDPTQSQDIPMSDDYTPPKVWTPGKENGGQFASINKPTAGAQYHRDLPVGQHPLQLYSLATPNGQKVTILLEELLEAGHDAEYDAWLIKIGDGDQFGSGFVAANPNSKIPALMDHSVSPPQRVFESGSILLYLAEKYGAFLPTDSAARTETLNWLFWQMGAGPYLGGGFGHFYAYAPTKIEYAIDRFTMEVKRQLDLLDKRLADSRFIAGDDYTIADMAIWPWYGRLITGGAYGDAATFLDAESYRNLHRWQAEIAARPAVQRGIMVNNVSGDPAKQLHERHDDAVGRAPGGCLSRDHLVAVGLAGPGADADAAAGMEAAGCGASRGRGETGLIGRGTSGAGWITLYRSTDPPIYGYRPNRVDVKSDIHPTNPNRQRRVDHAPPPSPATVPTRRVWWKRANRPTGLFAYPA